MEAFASKFYDYFFNYKAILTDKRLSWIDYAKGIAIFWVVYQHAFVGLFSAGLKVNSLLIYINMIVYSFRVPLFFILSGLFIERGLRKRGLKKYIQYRSRTVLYPYLLWAFLQIILSYFFRPYTNYSWGPQLFLFAFYEPKYMEQLWFLLALFNTSVLYVFVYTKLKIKGLGHLVLGIILYLLAPALSFNSMLQQLSIFYIYLAIGVLISSFILDNKRNALFGSAKIFFILLPFFIVSQYYFLHQKIIVMDPFFISYKNSEFSFLWLLNNDLIATQYFFIVIIESALILNICFILQRWKKIRFLRVIGFHSLYIYLMHILILVCIRTFFVFFIHYDETMIILLLQVVAACIGSIMIYNLCRHLNLNFLFEYPPIGFKNFFRIQTLLPKFKKVLIEERNKHLS